MAYICKYLIQMLDSHFCLPNKSYLGLCYMYWGVGSDQSSKKYYTAQLQYRICVI